MVLRDADALKTELDKLAVLEPDESVIPYMKTLTDRAHIELHMTALEADTTLDTSAARAAISG